MVANLATPVHVQSPGLPTKVVAYEVLVTAVHEGYTHTHTHTHIGQTVVSRKDTMHMWAYD